MSVSGAPANDPRAGRQAAWRDVNGYILAFADRLSASLGDASRGWTFMCECGQADCRALLEIPLARYRDARVAGRFLVAPGHEDGLDRLVEQRAGYSVVETPPAVS